MFDPRDRDGGRRGGLERRGAGLTPTHTETRIEQFLAASIGSFTTEEVANQIGASPQEARVALVKLRSRGAVNLSGTGATENWTRVQS